VRKKAIAVVGLFGGVGARLMIDVIVDGLKRIEDGSGR
jgi:hypothetical protein